MNKEYYKTSDYALAAWLCVRGYTLLGAIDAGRYDYNGHPRYDFVLTHQTLRSDPDVMMKNIHDIIEDYAKAFIFEGDEYKKPISFREYHARLSMCKKATFNPVTKEQVERS